MPSRIEPRGLPVLSGCSSLPLEEPKALEWPGATHEPRRPRFLLVGPYDPHCGEYTFLAPPLGVWRLQGVLEDAGYECEVFDPNCVDEPVHWAFDRVLRRGPWDVIGISTTGMTLRYDLELAHAARRGQPDALMVAGGMEATFKPELMFELGPFHLVVLGEGERPLLELGRLLAAGDAVAGVPGTAVSVEDGSVERFHQSVLDGDELTAAIALTPYERMPYSKYWERLEQAYKIGSLPHKAQREARLAEVRSVRLITLNYCPMGCSFCSSTNFLHAAQGSKARIRRLDSSEIMTMLGRIVEAQPDVRTIIFQDDIFVFTKDDRIMELCEAIVEAKRVGGLPSDLQFISTNRIDAMNPERLHAMRTAGFRVLGFGVESFSKGILEEFNKVRILPYIEPNLQAALTEGITPFLDLILTSPSCTIDDLSQNVLQGFRWLNAGCEMGMYPYVIPFSGADMAEDPDLFPLTVSERMQVAGTDVEWSQPTKILPRDPVVRGAILDMESLFEQWLGFLETRVAHLPSRIRSLLWILASSAVLPRCGADAPDSREVLSALLDRLPGLDDRTLSEVAIRFKRDYGVPDRAREEPVPA